MLGCRLIALLPRFTFAAALLATGSLVGVLACLFARLPRAALPGLTSPGLTAFLGLAALLTITGFRRGLPVVGSTCILRPGWVALLTIRSARGLITVRTAAALLTIGAALLISTCSRLARIGSWGRGVLIAAFRSGIALG